MKAEDIKVGVTYVNKYDAERTVIEIRSGLQKNRNHITYVRFTTEEADGIQLLRLKKFAVWAIGPQIESPVHKCKENTGYAKVKYKVYDSEWVLSFYGTKCRIVFCPFCGEKLKDPT